MKLFVSCSVSSVHPIDSVLSKRIFQKSNLITSLSIFKNAFTFSFEKNESKSFQSVGKPPQNPLKPISGHVPRPHHLHRLTPFAHKTIFPVTSWKMSQLLMGEEKWAEVSFAAGRKFKGYQDPRGQDNSLNTIPKNQNQYKNTWK